MAIKKIIYTESKYDADQKLWLQHKFRVLIDKTTVDGDKVTVYKDFHISNILMDIDPASAMKVLVHFINNMECEDEI